MIMVIGVWENYCENHEDCVKSFYPDAKTAFESCRDEDADIDEYEEEDSSLSDEASNEGVLKSQQKEARALQCIVKHLLPQVGSGVQKIVVSSSRGLTSSLLRSILVLCPNVLYLDISYTSVLDSAFKGLKEHSSCLNLQYLNMAGCENITDLGLFRLADCVAVLPPHVPEGTDHLRDVYLEDCCRFQSLDSACDCFFEIEESGLSLQKGKPCCQCRVKDFCNSVCFWQKDGIMCHLAKLSLQCPYVNSVERRSNCLVSTDILKTNGAFLSGSGQIDNKSLQYLNLSGCSKITDEGLRCLFDAGVLNKLQFLDVSGCWLLSGPELCSITDSLTHLKPENIFYCDQIFDGPYPDSANGCQNLENGIRACCRQVLL
ncbi:F-box/LRR-repeat protein 5 [Araneus ventricosus]|uniref:F-box/LRR-repeat protein 5 n=1 Tax=Araneus ventricosus TaxID=182803 RepID=A0A4Y2LVM3_ARAVE|nr:F-box/LRR-repeat protein 5 [Araneus ventricosus]